MEWQKLKSLKVPSIGKDMEQLELLILNNQWVKEEISKEHFLKYPEVNENTVSNFIG